MLRLYTAIFVAGLLGCIEARQPQPDTAGDAAAGDMQFDAAPIVDSGTRDQSIGDAAPIDMAADMPGECHAHEFLGEVYDCAITECNPGFFRDIYHQAACCDCNPELCHICRDIAG